MLNSGHIKKIIVGSTNPVKINATLAGFRQVFPGETFEISGLPAVSNVSNQPKDNTETLSGAHNRAAYIREREPQADYWVGIEGGIQEMLDETLAFAWVVIISNACIGQGRTGTFVLPNAVTRLIRQGKELGEADDIVFGRSNSKQDNGAVGLLTGNVIDRQELYRQAVVLSLIPFINRELYCKTDEQT